MSTVVVTFESSDGDGQHQVQWSVKDFADYKASVANGSHDRIIEAVTPMVRRTLEDDDVRVISTTVDGVPVILADG